MPIGIKMENYYTKCLKHNELKAQNGTFWVVIMKMKIWTFLEKSTISVSTNNQLKFESILLLKL